MTSSKTVKPRTSAAVVEMAADVYVNTRCFASPMRYARHRVNANTFPVTTTTVSARCRHRCPSPAVQVPVRSLGSGRMKGPEPHHPLRRASSARWHAHLWSAGKPPSVHRRSATTRTRFHSLRSSESCEAQLMTNVSISRQRPGPNPALELTCYGGQPCPGGNALRAFCATMPTLPAVARSSALR